MGGLFSSFNPTTEVLFNLPGNWLSAFALLIFVPQPFWSVKTRASRALRILAAGLINELRAVLGSLVLPGTTLIFTSLFVFILSINFLGLLPYVFTATRHLRITLSLSLPLWLGRVIYRIVNQAEHNLAHLVPEGAPGPLIPVMVIIETVSTVIRPGTLAVRLAANMVAGHLLLSLLGGQGPSLSPGLLAGLIIGLRCLITLECAVSCIQAYVFTILRTLYLAEHNRETLIKGNI